MDCCAKATQQNSSAVFIRFTLELFCPSPLCQRAEFLCIFSPCINGATFHRMVIDIPPDLQKMLVNVYQSKNIGLCRLGYIMVIHRSGCTQKWLCTEVFDRLLCRIFTKY